MIFSGSGMKLPMDEIIKLFKKQYPTINITVDYGGSGYLLSKILILKKGNIFIPGDTSFLNKLKKIKAIHKINIFAKHIPVIISKKNIHSIYELASPNIKIAIADKNVAIGKATDKILKRIQKKNSNLYHKIIHNITVKGSSVKQVVFYVLYGNVDVGIVWKADTYNLPKKINIIPIPNEINEIKEIPIAILKYGKLELSKKFYNFFITKGIKIFEKYGFRTIKTEVD